MCSLYLLFNPPASSFASGVRVLDHLQVQTARSQSPKRLSSCIEIALQVSYNGAVMEIFGIGIGEMMVIALVALIFLGPDRLPEVARSLGRGVAEICRATEPARSAWNDLTSDINTGDKQGHSGDSPRKGKSLAGPPSYGEHDGRRACQVYGRWSIPPSIAEDLAKVTLVQGSGSADTTGTQIYDLDYPMPHTEMTFQPARAALPPMEDLEYPVPGSANGHTEPPDPQA